MAITTAQYPFSLENKKYIEEGLKATLRLVIDPSLENATGEYFDGLKLAKANAQAYDKSVQRRLAALSHELTLDAASFVTGEILVIDGGFLASGVNQ